VAPAGTKRRSHVTRMTRSRRQVTCRFPQ
jgi:hypothetical protein